MNSIRELLDIHNRIWFWIEEDYKITFYEEIVSLGVTFINGDVVSLESIRHCMGIDRTEMKVGYVSNLVWFHSFGMDDSPLKVNYRRFREGENPYMISDVNIIPLLVDEEDYQ